VEETVGLPHDCVVATQLYVSPPGVCMSQQTGVALVVAHVGPV
jgi:hypothetical protein